MFRLWIYVYKWGIGGDNMNDSLLDDYMDRMEIEDEIMREEIMFELQNEVDEEFKRERGI